MSDNKTEVTGKKFRSLAAPNIYNENENTYECSRLSDDKRTAEL